MGRINVLDTHVANMIAAGEVCENPASVVKELLENAIDAKSSAVTVEIENGGITYIRVTDDGAGMAADDAKTAFLRHATSKISSEDDLSAIATLGFRGEALAAISAVSKIDLITKPREENMGITLRVEAGKVLRESESGCPDGTTIIVRELFYNTPARMRFLKKDRTEATFVENAVRNAALSHPEVSIRFIKDGKDIIHTPGDGTLKSCMYSVFGRDFANNMNEVSSAEHNVKVCGFACTPSATRGNRAYQFFFVNGRPVKSRLLGAALENAYNERIMKGRFPSCVLMINIPLDSVNVNVHPAKTEVKFAREREIFDSVYFGVKSALEKADKKQTVQIPAVKLPPIDNISAEQQRIDVAPQKARAEETPKKSFAKPKEYTPVFVPVSEEKEKVTLFRSESNFIYNTSAPKPQPAEEPKPVPATKEEPAEEPKEKPFVKFVGEVMNTYIIAEYDDKVIFIDKHAAHERIIFEKLRKTYGSVQMQMLMTPEIVDLDKSAAEALIENREELKKLGFEVDEFGDGSVAVSAVPDGIDAASAASVLDKLAESLKSGARAETPDVISETMYSVACKAAIKAGQKNSPEELKAIIDRVLFEDDIRYCPHGRPVMFEMSKYELERKFKRIV